MMSGKHLLALALLAWTVGGVCHASEGPKIIAAGDWSKPVIDNRGDALRGRLVVCEKMVAADRREAAVYIELQDARSSIGGSMRLFCDLGRTDFRPEYKGGLRCELHDRNGKLVPATGYPFSGGVPKSEWVTLPTDATIRLRTTPFGIHRPGALAISPEANQLWVIADNDPNEYFLSGTFTIAPTADQTPPGDEHAWRGTIVFPPARIVNKRP
jgi:hypothetical protein